MERDGLNKSLWQHDQANFSSGETDMKTIYDVVVVGGGITGITTALELQKRGKKCLLIEAKNLCFGTTGGTTAHINSFFDTSFAEVANDFGKEGAIQLATAARDALKMFADNIAKLKIDCEYRKMDGIVYAQDDKQTSELQEMYESAIEAGVPVSYVNSIPINDSFQQALSFEGQAQLHPVKYVYALAREFENAGGTILENCFATDVAQKDLLEIETSRGLLRSGKLIYATHIPPGINLLHLRCAPYRSYVMAIELEDDAYPISATYDMMDPYHYYRTQEIENQKFLIAGGEDHKTGHEENTKHPFEKLELYLRNIFKIREIKFKWSSQYFEPADGLAYIGHLPGASENIFVATGFGGNGITYSHIAAKILATKIVEDTDLYGGLFNPGRVKPVAGFTNFVKENADVLSSLIVDPFKISNIKSLTFIAKDAADTVKYNHQTLAIYKNEEGELFYLKSYLHALKVYREMEPDRTELGLPMSWCPVFNFRRSVNRTQYEGPEENRN